MDNFTIHNIGATIQGQKNSDGTYTVTTKGSHVNAKPVVKTMSEQEVMEKYGSSLERTPSKDFFEKANKMCDKLEPEVVHEKLEKTLYNNLSEKNQEKYDKFKNSPTGQTLEEVDHLCRRINSINAAYLYPYGALLL